MSLKTIAIALFAWCSNALAQFPPAPAPVPSVDDIVRQSNERRAAVIETLKQGIVRVEAQEEVKDTGTGIVISSTPERILILTALHVVKDAKSVDVIFYADRSTHVHARKLPRQSDALDLAVLEIASGPGVRLPRDITKYRFVVSSTVQPGTDVTTANGEWIPVRNSVTRLSHEGDIQKFEYTNVSVGEGFSGGPVFDQYGNVIGMHDALDGGGNFAVAIKIDSALQTLEALDYTVPKPESGALPVTVTVSQSGGLPPAATTPARQNSYAADMEHYQAGLLLRDPDQIEAVAKKISNQSLATVLLTRAAALRAGGAVTVPPMGIPADQAAMSAAAAKGRNSRTWLEADRYLHKRNYIKAFPLFQQLAESGDSQSMVTFAELYYNGWGTAQNYPEAARWYEKAAGEDETKAMTPLGSMYESGRGVPRDLKKAAEWYRKAAASGNATARQNLQRLGLNP